MRATQHTHRGALVRRIARTIGAVAIASGVAVTGAAASASADTVLELHNNVSNDNSTTGTGNCDDTGNNQTSYWHFILNDNSYGFASFTLNLGDLTPLILTSGWVSDGSGKPSHAYVAVPAGKTLTSLQLSGSSATVTPSVGADETVLFNLSHTCSGTPVVDVCNNIEGDQEQIPEGMISDGDGGCVTPPVDVCTNITGDQEQIPEGMISYGDGGCVTPPVDVCTNITGDQATVPAGYTANNGICTQNPPPPVDVCTNITGDQATVPTGYTANNGICTQNPPPPVDVCTNIAGDQATVPAGMSSDGQGACVTVQVSSNAPVDIDVCPNLAGDQSVVPDGYTLANGSCDAVASAAVAVPTPTATPADVTLPVTGSNTASGISIGFGMVLAGVVLSVLARRKAARTSI